MDHAVDVPETPDPTTVRTVPWWVGPSFAVLAVGTVPWTLYLAVSLPRHATFAHYRGAWVGFDCMLIVALGLTALLAWRARPQVALSATAAATLLVVDAWFDVLTTQKGKGLVVSLVLAGVVELPLAAICVWIAWHAERAITYRVHLFARRARRTNNRPVE